MFSLEYVKKYRHMPWIKRGMRVVVSGKEGHMAGGHEGGNIAVKFPNCRHSANCHPWWETVYYDKKGKIVADYREMWKERKHLLVKEQDRPDSWIG